MVGENSFGVVIMIRELVLFSVYLLTANQFLILDNSELRVMFSSLREGKSTSKHAPSAYKRGK